MQTDDLELIGEVRNLLAAVAPDVEAAASNGAIREALANAKDAKGHGSEKRTIGLDYTNEHSFQRDLLGHSTPEERLTKWDGFGSRYGQMLKAYQDDLNRRPHTYVAPAEIKELQDAGHLTGHKKPKITDSGRDEIRKSEDAEREDIRREVEEVNKPKSTLNAAQLREMDALTNRLGRGWEEAWALVTGNEWERVANESFFATCPRDEKGHCTTGGGVDPGQFPEYRGGALHTSDVNEAAKALVQGRKVVLSQPRQVATLLDKLAKMVHDAEARGEKAPTYDLCNVSVPGTNLFCAESKGIPRIKMPQLRGIPTKGSEADRNYEKDDKGKVTLQPHFVANLFAVVNANPEGHNQWTSGRGLRKVEEQVREANRILMARHGKPPQNFKLVDMKLSDIKPGQTGEDYDNATSRYMGEQVKEGAVMPPMAVDAEGNIIDGNHRHAAHTFAGKESVTVLKAVGLGKGLGKLVANLKSQGVKVSDVEMEDASHLRASQNQLDGAKAARMLRGARKGKAQEPIIVSRDNYIVDGHHHWAGQVAHEFEKGGKGLKIPVRRVDMDIIELLNRANKYAARMGMKSEAVTGNVNPEGHNQYTAAAGAALKRSSDLSLRYAGRRGEEGKDFQAKMALQLAKEGRHGEAAQVHRNLAAVSGANEVLFHNAAAMAHDKAEKLRPTSNQDAGIDALNLKVRKGGKTGGIELLTGPLLLDDEDEEPAENAKDAKGHGSEKRGEALVHEFLGRGKPPAEVHAGRLAVSHRDLIDAVDEVGRGSKADVDAFADRIGAYVRHLPSKAAKLEALKQHLGDVKLSAGQTDFKLTGNYSEDEERDEKGRWTSEGGSATAEHEGGHDPLEAVGHEAHMVHEFEDVVEHDPTAIIARHAYGPALKGAAALLDRAGGHRAAEAITALHDGARQLAGGIVSRLQARYGKATAGAILGAAHTLTGATLSAAGLGAIGSAIPGKHFVAAIPLLGLAEAGRALGVLGPDSKFEKAVGGVGAVVHAVRSAIGKGVQLAAKGGLKAAYGLGRATRTASDVMTKLHRKMTGNELETDVFGNPVWNEGKELSDEEIQEQAKQLLGELAKGWNALMRQHGGDLQHLPDEHQPVRNTDVFGNPVENEAKLDRQGGALPNIDKDELKEYDFVTLPKGEPGTHCKNCKFLDTDKDGHFCDHEKLRGQRVTDRNCCALWDADGTLRTWKGRTTDNQDGGGDDSLNLRVKKGKRQGGIETLLGSGKDDEEALDERHESAEEGRD